MRRLVLIGAIMGALLGSVSQARAQYYYRRPARGPLRAAARAALPPYGYRARPRYGAARPGWYWGPGGFWW